MPPCPHCGQEIDPGLDVCPACGQSLTTLEEPAGPPQVIEPPPITAVNITDYFKAGWELFKKYPAGFVGYFVLVIVISMVLRMVPVIGWLAGFALVSPLNAGFFVVSAKLLKNQRPQFADFFSGLKFYFVQLALFGIVSSILITIGLILLIVPGIYLIVSYLFALMFIVDRGLDFWPAMETSRRAVQPLWFKFFTFLLLVFLLNLAGALLLGVGLLVTVPLTHCIFTVAFDDIFGVQAAHTLSMNP
ncbi:MAG: hypothetical protein ACOC6K_00655, partial [Thermodesulfobacteriota bacterium]